MVQMPGQDSRTGAQQADKAVSSDGLLRLNTDTFEAVDLIGHVTKKVFLEDGVYTFALALTFDPDPLPGGERRVDVEAGCQLKYSSGAVLSAKPFR